MQVSVPLLLHGLLEAAVEDFVEGADPLVHLCLAVCRQQERALILHLQLKGKPANFAVLQEDHANIHLKHFGPSVKFYIQAVFKLLFSKFILFVVVHCEVLHLNHPHA